jgi:hypothetical protein
MIWRERHFQAMQAQFPMLSFSRRSNEVVVELRVTFNIMPHSNEDANASAGASTLLAGKPMTMS